MFNEPCQSQCGENISNNSPCKASLRSVLEEVNSNDQDKQEISQKGCNGSVEVKFDCFQYCNEADIPPDCEQSGSTEADLEETLITESMLAEEEHLLVEGEKKAQEAKQQALEEWQRLSENVRLTQLNHLLEKSSIYANYLLDVIESSKAREKRRVEKREKQKNQDADKKINAKKVKIPEHVTRSHGKKRKYNECVESVSKKKKASKKDSCVEPSSEANTPYRVGGKVQIRKVNKDGEEDLLEAKILDMREVTGKIMCQVHYFGLKRTNDEWVAQSLIVSDVCDDEYMNAKHSLTKENVMPRMKSAIARIDEEALFSSKLHQGRNDNDQICTVDGIRYFDGQRVPESQPELFTGGILREYQVAGFKWLKVLFENTVNGILADEMGLGKTVQCIAMICGLIKCRFRGPFLVCAPLSTITNWINEFKRFAPQIPVLLYHGTEAERAILRSSISKANILLNCFPVVITSYEILIRDRPSFGRQSWDYLIVDEGHRIKNMNCRLIRELKMLKVSSKVLLTGTPLQNSLAELWSLMNFLLPEVFNDLSTFEAWFDLTKIQKGTKVISSAAEQNVVVMLHKILAPFLLRRTKSDIEIYLPPKRELVLFAPLAQEQNKFYQAVVDRTIRKLLKQQVSNGDKEDVQPESDVNTNDVNGVIERKTRSSTLSFRLANEKKKSSSLLDDSEINLSLNNTMMQLRKCCNHPYLIQYPLIPGTDIYRVDDELIATCGKMQLLDRMLPVLQSQGHKILLFSQMTKILDILEDYCNYKHFSYLRLDGRTKCNERQEYIDKFNNDPDQFLFLLSTRAGGLGINLTSADTVIIYDSDWNPQNDLQAQDRCHRIGQTRSVMIYRFVSANTVDQFMVERAEAKRVLERMVINRSKFKGKLADDIKSNESAISVSTTLLSMLKVSADTEKCGKPISESDLQKILNREIVMSCKAEDISCGVFQTSE